MSIREYIENLSIEQLRFVTQEASRIVEDRRNQEKVPIYLVSDEDCNWYALPVGKEEEVFDAAIYLLQEDRRRMRLRGKINSKIQVNIDVVHKIKEDAESYIEDLKWSG